MHQSIASALILTLLITVNVGFLPIASSVSIYIEMLLLGCVLTTLIFTFIKSKNISHLLVNSTSDIFVLVFTLVWLANSYYTGIYGIDNLVALLRYVAIAYFVGIFFGYRNYYTLSKWIFYIGISQIFIGSLQLLTILPNVLVDLGDAPRKPGLHGIFKDTVSYSAALLFSLLVYSEIIKGKKTLITHAMVSLILCFIFLSGSRAYFLIGVLYTGYGYLRLKTWQIFLLLLIALPSTLFIEIDLGSNNNDFFFFLSPSFFYVAMQQRLGIVLELLPQYINTFDMFFGYGSDKVYVVTRLLSEFNYYYLSPINIPYILEDVYWFTMLVYYGVIGTAVYLIYILGIFKSCYKVYHQSGELQRYLNVYIWATISLFLLNFFGQAAEVKIFSFYYWIYAGSILFARRHVRRAERQNSYAVQRKKRSTRIPARPPAATD